MAGRDRPSGDASAREKGGALSDPAASGVNETGSQGAGRAGASEEARLVAEARHDRAAFGRLYDHHVNAIYHYVLRRVGDVELAEDITAAVWEHALSAVARYEDRGLPFVAWLYRIAGNMVANHYRRERLRRFVPFLGQVSAPDVSGRIEDRSVVQQGLAALSVADQEILGLHYYAGLAPAEIADVLGCSVPVVHKRLQRARERLRANVEGGSRG